MKLEWRQRSKAHWLWADGRDRYVKVVYRPRLKHYGVYQATRSYTHRGKLYPSFSKVTFGLTLEEAKASAVAIYLLTKE